MTKQKNPTCPYCGSESAKTTGHFVYPHVKRLNNRTFYYCDHGHEPAWVGSHKRTGRPLGTLANAELRALRSATHTLFDPLWQGKPRGTRDKLYTWLSMAMGIPPHKTHIGMFTLEQCHEAQRHIKVAIGEKIKLAMEG